MDIGIRVQVAVHKSLGLAPTIVVLRLEDDASGELLGAVEFTAEQWLDVTTGLVASLPGETSPHLERVGRKMAVRRADVPRDAVTAYDRRTAELQAKAWAESQRVDEETVEVRKTNAGWVAVYRSWPEAV